MPDPNATVYVEVRRANGDVYRLTGEDASKWYRRMIYLVQVAAYYGYPFDAPKLDYAPPPRPTDEESSPLLENRPPAT